MPIVPTGFVKQREIAAAVSHIERQFGPDVVRLRHSIGPDWSGDPSIFFRIVLSDPASREDRLAEVARRVENALIKRLNPMVRWGLIPYFNFRSQSEQAELKEKAWA